MSAGPARNLAVYHDHEGFTTLWSSKSFAIMKSRFGVRIVAADRGSRAREPGRAVPTGAHHGAAAAPEHLPQNRRQAGLRGRSGRRWRAGVDPDTAMGAWGICRDRAVIVMGSGRLSWIGLPRAGRDRGGRGQSGNRWIEPHSA